MYLRLRDKFGKAILFIFLAFFTNGYLFAGTSSYKVEIQNNSDDDILTFPNYPYPQTEKFGCNILIYQPATGSIEASCNIEWLIGNANGISFYVLLKSKDETLINLCPMQIQDKPSFFGSNSSISNHSNSGACSSIVINPGSNAQFDYHWIISLN